MEEIKIKKLTSLLEKIKKKNPKHSLGAHIYKALVAYHLYNWDGESLFYTTDKEMFTALNNYLMLMSVEDDEEEINKIVEEGKHLETLFLDSEEEEDYE